MAIITISRQMGTGAYQVAKEVARRLKYSLVDSAKIDELAGTYGLTTDALMWIDEKPPATITGEEQRYNAYHCAMELLLLECSRSNNIIIYGRGAQDLLAGMHNILRIRFVAPFEKRVETFAEREWLDPELARALIRKSDQQRNCYVDYYYERDWNDPLGYDLVFNTSELSPQTITESIISAARDQRLVKSEEDSMYLLEDKIICKRIETEMLKSGVVQYLHFRTEVAGRVVTFTGHVHNDEERHSAIAIAQETAGVIEVVDCLQVVDYRRYRNTQ